MTAPRHLCALPRVLSSTPDGDLFTCHCQKLYRLHPIVRRWFRYFPKDETP